MLLTLNLLLGIAAVWIAGQPNPNLDSPNFSHKTQSIEQDLVKGIATDLKVDNPSTATPVVPSNSSPTASHHNPSGPSSTSFADVKLSTLTNPQNPFRREAAKVLSGNLEEGDSISRRRILNYCEHLRVAYPTRDLDFIRQVFSDDALIIVGHVVKSTKSDIAGLGSEKVRYSIRSKQQYLDQLAKIFNDDKELDVKFSDFRIMRHPTMNGIYGVTLRQKYTCGNYSDDGYLFLLWDFRNPSMPLIHVRTWQPSGSLSNPTSEIIGIEDFNLE